MTAISESPSSDVTFAGRQFHPVLFPAAEDGTALLAIFVRARLHEVPLDGLSDEDAAVRLGHHLRRTGYAGAFVATVFIEAEGQRDFEERARFLNDLTGVHGGAIDLIVAGSLMRFIALGGRMLLAVVRRLEAEGIALETTSP